MQTNHLYVDIIGQEKQMVLLKFLKEILNKKNV